MYTMLSMSFDLLHACPLILIAVISAVTRPLFLAAYLIAPRTSIDIMPMPAYASALLEGRVPTFLMHVMRSLISSRNFSLIIATQA